MEPSPQPEPKWTQPFCGVTHLGGLSDERSASVTAWPTSADATLWSRHSSMWAAPTFNFESLDQAKAACESWVKSGVVPAMTAVRS